MTTADGIDMTNITGSNTKNTTSTINYSKVESDSNEHIKFKWKRELKIWMKLSFFSVSRMFVELFPWFISLSLVGHKSTVALAALSVVEIWVYTWIVISWDFVSTTESVLISQALGYGEGKKKSKSLFSIRSWLSLSMVVMVLCNVVVSMLCISTNSVLLLWGFDKQIAYEGSVYAVNIIPAVFFEGFNICLTGYLTSIQLAWPSTVVGCIAVIVDTTTSYLLIYGQAAYNDPLKSVAVGWITTSLISLVLNSIITKKIWGDELIYSLHGKEEIEIHDEISSPLDSLENAEAPSRINDDCLLGNNDNSDNKDNKNNDKNDDNGDNNDNNDTNDNDNEDNNTSPYSFSISVLKRIFLDSISKRRVGVYTKLAVPNFASSCVQNLSFLCISFLAAKLGTLQVAVHNSNIALLELTFTIIRGMAEATTIRIGYHIGAGNVDDAKRVIALSAMVNGVFGIIAASLGYSFRYQIALLLTNDPLVIEKSADLAAMLWSSYFLYAIGATGLAALEGQGKSVEYAILQTIGQWCVTVPLAFISFFFTNWNLQGIWFSMVCGYSVTNFLAIALLYFDTDWKKIVEAARVRQYQEVAETTTTDEN